MSRYEKEVSGIQFQQCCIETLKFIRVKLEVGKVLERCIIPAVFVLSLSVPRKEVH